MPRWQRSLIIRGKALEAEEVLRKGINVGFFVVDVAASGEGNEGAGVVLGGKGLRGNVYGRAGEEGEYDKQNCGGGNGRGKAPRGTTAESAGAEFAAGGVLDGGAELGGDRGFKRV